MAKKIFVAHIHEDDQEVGDLVKLLADHGHWVTDSSVTQDEPNKAKDKDYIRYQILAPRIDESDELVVLVSPGMRDSEHVEWEIEYANKLGKRIVGVWAQNGTEDDLPDALKDYSDAVVGWQAERIYEAIDGQINNWETSKGELRGTQDINRHNC